MQEVQNGIKFLGRDGNALLAIHPRYELVKVIGAQAGEQERCGDAREIGILDHVGNEELHREYLARGVLTIVESRSIPGSFMVPGAIAEVKSTIHRMLDRLAPLEREGLLDLFVQVASHGDVRLRSGVPDGKIVYPTSELYVKSPSCINCGMSHAEHVWEELMADIIKSGKTGEGVPLIAEFYDKEARRMVNLKIAGNSSMLRLLQQVYGYEGSNPAKFVTSITDLLEHPLLQKVALRAALRDDPLLSGVRIHINAVIKNYITGLTARIDTNDHVFTILDDLARIRSLLLSEEGLIAADDPERLRREAIQKTTVEAGLICPSGITAPRSRLASLLGINVAGGVFGMIDGAMLHQYVPHNPYNVVGLHYLTGEGHLGVQDIHMVARTEEELLRMESKNRRDPLFRNVLERNGVHTHRLMEPDLPNIDGSKIEAYRERYREALRRYMRNPPEKSPLRLPVINPKLARV